MTTTPPVRRTKPPSLLACIACRTSHLKCSGVKPICARCREKNTECIWIESRRGYRDYRKSSPPNQRPAKHRDPASFFTSNVDDTAAPEAFVLDASLAAAQPFTYDELFNTSYGGVESISAYDDPTTGFPSFPIAFSHTDMESSPDDSTSPSTASISRDFPISHQPTRTHREPSDLIDVFYKYFYPAHPFVLPPKRYKQNPNCLPEPLLASMRCVAAHFVPNNHNIPALQRAALSAFSSSTPDDLHKVQALLVYTTVCYGRYEHLPGAAALDMAIRIALNIGLHKSTFAKNFSGGTDPVLEESCRRTWWAMYVIDGLVTAIGGQAFPFRLHSIPSDVPLPGSDADYNSLRPTTPLKTLDDFRNRAFTEDPHSYSSLAYAIEATHLLGQTFLLQSIDTTADTFSHNNNHHQCGPDLPSLDASITSFLLSIPPYHINRPPTTQQNHSPPNNIDESLLLAHMTINWASLLLHRPHSTLTYLRASYTHICHPPSLIPFPHSSETFPSITSHTSATLTAANNLLSLASAPRPLVYCTPSMMCALLTASTVHLPAYAIATTPSEASGYKERLKLGLVVLERFGEIWPRAGIAKRQLAGFAREVLCVESSGGGGIGDGNGGGGGGGGVWVEGRGGGLPWARGVGVVSRGGEGQQGGGGGGGGLGEDMSGGGGGQGALELAFVRPEVSADPSSVDGGVTGVEWMELIGREVGEGVV